MSVKKFHKFRAKMPKGGRVVIEGEGDQSALDWNIKFWGERGYTIIEKAEVYEKDA